MLAMLPITPNKNRKAANCQGALAKPRLVKATTYNGAVIVSIFLLPYFVTNLAEKGMVNNCPAGSANNILPRAASERFRLYLMSGIRLAQEAKPIPCPK